MSFSPDQLKEMQDVFQAMFKQFGIAAMASGGGAEKKTNKRKLYDKQYKDQGKFGGGESAWKQWAFQFRIATKIGCHATMEGMDMITSLKDQMSVTDLIMHPRFQGDKEEMELRATELYDILCLRCEGEALVVVQSIAMMDGFAAWQKLEEVYNLQTTAKVMSKVMMVVAPPKVLALKKMVSSVEDWEAKERDLKIETGETIPDRFRMAILTTMCPPSIQEHVFQQTAKTRRMQISEIRCLT